jgi:A/G-specific adenine glycosylase
MPWKGEKDPYKIWISEIVLQQTRVQQGLHYYNRFITSFPNVRSLAMAPEQKVFKLWEGLGYYSRCKNLIASAKYIYENLDGKFPEKFEDILSLKGVGTYTASAIASFAFNKPYAVLDGNVFRVLSRFFGIETPINTLEGKKVYAALALQLLDLKKPGEYNQAIMDFGAVICKPSLPLCLECPLKKKCIAFKSGKVFVLPVNNKIIRQKARYFNYLIVKYDNKVYVKKRTRKDIWQNLFEFILIETESFVSSGDVLKLEIFSSLFKKHNYTINFISKEFNQKLTHQLIMGRFFHIELRKPLQVSENLILVSENDLNLLPFPKFIAAYLQDKNVSLNLIQ